MKVGIEQSGRIIWFGWRHFWLFYATCLVLSTEGKEYEVRFKWS